MHATGSSLVGADRFSYVFCAGEGRHLLQGALQNATNATIVPLAGTVGRVDLL
jgi:hypothetical protein